MHIKGLSSAVYIHVDAAKDILKEHLIVELDYSLVPEEVWVKLVEWYDMAPGSRPIARKVVEYSLQNNIKHSKVEVYLMELKLVVHPTMSNHPLSGDNTVGEYCIVDDYNILHS